MLTTQFDIFQWIGFIGMACVVYAYFLIQSEKVTKHNSFYQWLNLIGAILLIISLFVHFNLGSFLIEVFWVGITLYGMIQSKRRAS